MLYLDVNNRLLAGDEGLRRVTARPVNQGSDTGVSVREAGVADRPVLERLWLMFRHDISEFDGLLPSADGTFRSERLQAIFEDADWAPYLLTRGERPSAWLWYADWRGMPAS